MYCEWWIGQRVKIFPEYDAQDWDGLKTALLRTYRREDEEQQAQTVGFLEAFKNQKWSGGDDMRQYCETFAVLSRQLVQRGELGRYQQIECLIQGIPKEMAEIIILLTKLDPYNPESLNFDIAYEVALPQIQSDDADTATRRIPAR